MQKSKALFLSFWNISLENFPDGGFTKRLISTEEAKQLIDGAQKDKKLRCVTQDDILAPYGKRELKNHHELIEAMKVLGIDLSLEGFTMEPNPDDDVSTIFPLQFASVSEKADLLVVTCSYTMGPRNRNATDIDEMVNFAVAEDSIRFHLFEEVEAP